MPRAKKTDTKTAPKKAPAKKRVVKKKEPTVEQIVQEQVQKQLEEALLNIEFEVPEQNTDAFVDMDLLRAEIKKEVEFAQKTAEHQKKVAGETKAELTRSELTLSSDEKDFRFTSGIDGLVISEKDKPLLTLGKSGQVGVGLRAPRSMGIGSMHVRANYPSEAPLPTTGKGSTRGLIVEGDGDDQNSFTFRAVSRMNRQGTNITGDGSLMVGLNNDKTQSRFTVNQVNYDENTVNLYTGSKQYANDMLSINVGSLPDRRFNFINATGMVEENGKQGINVFRVDGEGSVFTEQSVFSNKTGYAELYEWADLNPKKEDRNGFTVTVDEEGKLRIADEGDPILGVICEHAAFIGNAGWNYKSKYLLNEGKNPKKQTVKIVEWEDEVGLLHSHFYHTLPADFQLPDNATVYETDEFGDSFEVPYLDPQFNLSQEYTQRLDRGWVPVALTGRVKVWKGQFMNPNWIKVKDVNDDLEEWILK